MKDREKQRTKDSEKHRLMNCNVKCFFECVFACVACLFFWDSFFGLILDMFVVYLWYPNYPVTFFQFKN